MTVSTTTRHGKTHTTDCSTLFEALELVEGLLQLDTFVSVRIGDDELITNEGTI